VQQDERALARIAGKLGDLEAAASDLEVGRNASGHAAPR
jgi:hypothetical protein